MDRVFPEIFHTLSGFRTERMKNILKIICVTKAREMKECNATSATLL